MDDQLKEAQDRILDLEMQLTDAVDKNENFRTTIRALEQDRSRLNSRLNTATNIMEMAGLKLEDNDALTTDADKVQRLKKLLEKGQHMETFETINKDSPILQNAWERYMAAIRLCGFDGTNKVEMPE